MLPEGEENPSKEGPNDPRDRPGDATGRGGSDFGPRPGEYPTGPNQNGTPVVRKLALDLSGVAGFAIVDRDGDTSSMSAGADSVRDGIRLVTSAAAESEASGSASSAIWLDSRASGQVLRARALTRDPSALQKTVLGRSGIGLGNGELGGIDRGWVAQEDPGAAPPGGTDGSQPIDGSGAGGAGGTDSGGDSGESAGEQAGLLKITQEGEVVPALVALEEQPIELPETADAGAPPPEPGAEGDPNAQPPVGAGGATSGPTTGAGGAPPAGNPGPAPAPGPALEPLPRVTAVGLSPDGNVYILFERSFMYRAPSPEEWAKGGNDIYGPNSPYR